jgi:hypothetical protein
VPSKRKTQIYAVDYVELAKAAHSDPSAYRVMLAHAAIAERGGRPEIFYSKMNGYWVRDALAPHPFV